MLTDRYYQPVPPQKLSVKWSDLQVRAGLEQNRTSAELGVPRNTARPNTTDAGTEDTDGIQRAAVRDGLTWLDTASNSELRPRHPSHLVIDADIEVSAPFLRTIFDENGSRTAPGAGTKTSSAPAPPALSSEKRKAKFAF
jgi:hypothetical protein